MSLSDAPRPKKLPVNRQSRSCKVCRARKVKVCSFYSPEINLINMLSC